MKKRYIVGVREVHLRHYAVTAKNEDEAKDLVNERGHEVTDLEFAEFSHELNRDTWFVEESTEETKPTT